MERSFDPTVFTKNRKRLLEHRVGQGLLDEVVWEADCRGLLSDEHFSVDLIIALVYEFYQWQMVTRGWTSVERS